MIGITDIPFISVADMRLRAEKFIAQYHPSRQIPVPIEEIIEFDFGMDIIAMPGFHLNYEVDAFLSTCLTEIRIDKAVAESKNKNRYRFSLAHELSHRVLHAGIFSKLKANTIAEWIESREAISPEAYNRLEWQANKHAGLILAPPAELAGRFRAATDKMEAASISVDDATEEDWQMIERVLASDFQVSPLVIRFRGESDELWCV